MLLFSSIAWAGITEEEAAQEVQRIQVELGERLLIGAVGPEAERAFARQARMNRSLDIELVRIPTAGDLSGEQQVALQRAGLRCGVLFASEDTGWSITPFGDCTPRPPDEPALAAVTSGPTAAVISDTPVPDTLAAYERRSLTVREREGTWEVVEGARPLTAPAFAALIHDAPTEATLALEKKRAASTTRAFRVGGALVATAGLLPFLGMPSLSTPEGEDRVWTALFLTGTGLMAVVVAPRAIEGISDTQRQLDGYYTPEQARAHADAYNLALKQELGLDTPAPEASDQEAAEALIEPDATPDTVGTSSAPAQPDVERPE